jgi:hypothetical protein
MLDFYLLLDHQSKPQPSQLKQLDYIGGLDKNVFEQLVRKGIIDTRFDFYSDFRWNLEVVTQIDQKIQLLRNDTDVQKLANIIHPALEKQSGLIAYCD